MDPSLPVLSEEDRAANNNPAPGAQNWRQNSGIFACLFRCCLFSNLNQEIISAQTTSTRVFSTIMHTTNMKSIFMTFFNFVKPFIPAVLPLFNKTLFKLWWFSIKHFNVSSSLLCASSSCHTNYICPWEFYFIRIKTNFNSHLFFNLLHIPTYKNNQNIDPEQPMSSYLYSYHTRMNPMNHLAKSAK